MTKKKEAQSVAPGLIVAVFALCAAACDGSGGDNETPPTAVPGGIGGPGGTGAVSGGMALDAAVGTVAVTPGGGTNDASAGGMRPPMDSGAPLDAAMSGGTPAGGQTGGARADSGSSQSDASSDAGARADGGGATGGDAGTGACPHAMMKGNNFLTIGDSWIQLPGSQVTQLEDSLKAAGVLAQSEHFDRREVSGAPLPSIVRQYTGKDTSNVKVLIMDGGGIDLFTTALGDQAAIAPIVQQFKDFLQKVKADGDIEHIIYSLYPVIPSTPNLNQNMKAGFSEACENGPVDCHIVDLEPLFKGQHFASDRTHSDEAGAKLIAKAWWEAMQNNCIAQ